MIRNIIEEVKVICELPKGVFPIAGLAIGWPDQKSKISIRLSQDIVTHFNKYNEKDLIHKINKYDAKVFKKIQFQRKSNVTLTFMELQKRGLGLKILADNYRFQKEAILKIG